VELTPAGSRVTVLARLADDPFAGFQPAMRGFDAVLEIVSPGISIGALARTVEGTGARLEDLVHTDLSAALAGRVHSVIPPETTRFRYLYVMRRKAGTSHEEYVDYYTRVHADFGRRTPAIAGYEQIHLDEAASLMLCETTGFTVHRADSVSELSIPSLEDFFGALATSPVSREGPADELNFVDRPNSVGLCAEVTVRLVAS
jgi:hypothetical protein